MEEGHQAGGHSQSRREELEAGSRERRGRLGYDLEAEPTGCRW